MEKLVDSAVSRSGHFGEQALKIFGFILIRGPHCCESTHAICTRGAVTCKRAYFPGPPDRAVEVSTVTHRSRTARSPDITIGVRAFQATLLFVGAARRLRRADARWN